MATGRRPFFCGNWKLNGSISESLALATAVRNGVAGLRDVDVAVAPTFTALYAVAKRLEDGPVTVAAQDCFWEEKGAFTGEVSPSQLVDAGCRHVIIGHTERRQLFGELDAAVNLKAHAALRAGLAPIICVGETLAERDAGETIGRVQAQLDAALTDIDEAGLERVVIAYEPVWAIGTGRNASDPEAQEVQLFVRDWLVKNANRDFADRVRIIYGGSMKPENAQGLMEQADVDGGLIGGAALKPDSFLAICKTAASWYEKEKSIGRN